MLKGEVLKGYAQSAAGEAHDMRCVARDRFIMVHC